jgi:hypothetical protein
LTSALSTNATRWPNWISTYVLSPWITVQSPGEVPANVVAR